MAKKRSKRRMQQFRKNTSVITYNKYEPNRQARRLGIKPEIPSEGEKVKKMSRAELMRQKMQQVKETEKRIVPKGMTYGEYMEYLKEKRVQLKEKITGWQK